MIGKGRDPKEEIVRIEARPLGPPLRLRLPEGIGDFFASVVDLVDIYVSAFRPAVIAAEPRPALPPRARALLIVGTVVF